MKLLTAQPFPIRPLVLHSHHALPRHGLTSQPASSQTNSTGETTMKGNQILPQMASQAPQGLLNSPDGLPTAKFTSSCHDGTAEHFYPSTTGKIHDIRH